jgi:hypothetical protein
MSMQYWLPLERFCSCPDSVGYQWGDPAHVKAELATSIRILINHVYAVLVTSRKILIMSRQCQLPVGGSCSCLGSVGNQKVEPAHVWRILVMSS